ncbi:MAG TPA: hypothetical protein VFN10_08125 [Thermoanaerobaculia bacterium]|nr:hypothetical protein [Thermoanaerobaculia bacterium]
MSETNQPVELSEDRVPVDGIDETIQELVELYGGELGALRAGARDFTLPLRRGAATAGSIECSVTWQDETVTLRCNRDVDAPRAQRIMLLIAGVIGGVLFMLWPFFPHEKEFGTLAWLGGAVAIAVYLMSLRKTSGGIAFDFLQRLARAQRER